MSSELLAELGQMFNLDSVGRAALKKDTQIGEPFEEPNYAMLMRCSDTDSGEVYAGPEGDVEVYAFTLDELQALSEEDSLEYTTLQQEFAAGYTAKGNVKAATRKKNATLSKGRFPIFNKRSALAAIKLRGHAKTPAERSRILTKAAKFAPEEAKAAREADQKMACMSSKDHKMSEEGILDTPMNCPECLLKVPVAVLGTWDHPVYGEVIFSESDFDQIQSNFRNDVCGYEPPLYLGHSMDDSKIGEQPAVGHLKELFVEGEVLFGTFLITNESAYAEVVQNKSFRYSSAEITRNASHKVTSERLGTLLTAVALTNQPFLTGMPTVESLSEYVCPVDGDYQMQQLSTSMADFMPEQPEEMETLDQILLSDEDLLLIESLQCLLEQEDAMSLWNQYAGDDEYTQLYSSTGYKTTGIPAELREKLNAANEALLKFKSEKEFNNAVWGEGSLNLSQNGVLRIPLVKKGRWHHDAYGVVEFGDQDFEDIVNNFEKDVLGFEPYATYGHPLDPEVAAVDAELKKGQLKAMEIQNDVLYGLFDAKADAYELVANGEFEYNSPELIRNFTDKETGKNIGTVLMRTALTNAPFIPFREKVQALSTSAGSEGNCPQSNLTYALKLRRESFYLSQDSMPEPTSVTAAQEPTVASTETDNSNELKQELSSLKANLEGLMGLISGQKADNDALKAELEAARTEIEANKAATQQFSTRIHQQQEASLLESMVAAGVPPATVERFSQVRNALQGAQTQSIKLTVGGAAIERNVADEIAHLLVDAFQGNYEARVVTEQVGAVNSNGQGGINERLSQMAASIREKANRKQIA